MFERVDVIEISSGKRCAKEEGRKATRNYPMSFHYLNDIAEKVCFFFQGGILSGLICKIENGC
mgnify:CR=1 FL=1